MVAEQVLAVFELAEVFVWEVLVAAVKVVFAVVVEEELVLAVVVLEAASLDRAVAALQVPSLDQKV